MKATGTNCGQQSLDETETEVLVLIDDCGGSKRDCVIFIIRNLYPSLTGAYVEEEAHRQLTNRPDETPDMASQLTILSYL